MSCRVNVNNWPPKPQRLQLLYLVPFNGKRHIGTETCEREYFKGIWPGGGACVPKFDTMKPEEPMDERNIIASIASISTFGDSRLSSHC